MMRVALIQMNSTRDPNENARTLAALLPVDDYDLVVTPENTNIMGYDGGPLLDRDPVVALLRDYAQKRACHVLAGSLIVRDENQKAYNRQVLFGPKGEELSHYDKIHMFDVSLENGQVYKESDFFQKGDRALVSPVLDTKLGHSICYDLRFPQLYRLLAQNGAGILVVPAAFTKYTGQAHWRSLLRARAIETGSFILAPAQTGRYRHADGSIRETYGHSMIISPWGDILGALGTEVGVLTADLDLGDVTRARAQIPSLVNQEFSI